MKEDFQELSKTAIYAEAAVSSKIYITMMILLFAVALIVGIVKAEAAEGTSEAVKTGIFFQWFAVIYVGGVGLFGALRHILPGVRHGVANSIGWKSNGFQLEVGFAFLATAIIMITAFNQWGYQATYAVALLWSIFAILSGSNHVYEFGQGNKAESNITAIWWDFIPPLIMMVTGGIGLP
jgi:hypothetical protein